MQLQSTTPEQDPTVDAMVRPRGKPRPTLNSTTGINYARISTTMQQTSIPAQWKYNEKSAARLGIAELVRLKDEQSGLDDDRADYQELLRLARTGQYGWILLYAFDRLARDDGELIDVCEELLGMGVRIWDYSDGEITTRNLHEKAAKAYAEVRKIATRTQDGLEIRASEGVKLGSTMLGYVHKPSPGVDAHGRLIRYGYTDDGKPDQYDIHPVIGPAITKLFERCAAGESLGSLRLWFNQTTGLRLYPTDLKDLLRHEFYCGKIVGCKARYSKKNLDGHYARPPAEWQRTTHNKPLTDVDTWKRVQARLDEQAVGHGHHAAHQRSTPSRYALTGLVWCASCGSRMYGDQIRPNAHRYECKVCGKAKGCKMVERAVAAALANVTVNIKETVRKMAARMSTRRSEMGAALERARAQLEQVHDHRTNMAMLLAARRIDDEQYQRSMARYDRQSDELAEQVRELEHHMQHMPAHADLAQLDVERLPDDVSLHAALMLWPVERTQELYKMCVKRVVIDADNNRVRVEYVDHFQPLWGPAIEVTMSRKRR